MEASIHLILHILHTYIQEPREEEAEGLGQVELRHSLATTTIAGRQGCGHVVGAHGPVLHQQRQEQLQMPGP